MSARWRGRSRPGDEVPTLVGIYRARNAPHVRRLIAPARDHGFTVAWWALDEVVPELARVTIGTGRGTKLPLLNELLERVGGVGDADWLEVCDDDVVFDRGDVGQLVSLCSRAGLDLAQPSRSETVVDHEITRRRRLSVARLTTFVEIGPLFVVGPRWRDRILPFPSEREMGWGLELEWLELGREGCRLGIVDALSVHHEGGRAEEYDFERQHEAVFAELADRGIGHWTEFQDTLSTWRPWRRTAPWLPTGRGGG